MLGARPARWLLVKEHIDCEPSFVVGVGVVGFFAELRGELVWCWV